MRLLLRSPLHFLMSRSLLLITYEGRKSGRRYTTPLRYTREGEVIRCFTSGTTQWWRNLGRRKGGELESGWKGWQIRGPDCQG